MTRDAALLDATRARRLSRSRFCTTLAGDDEQADVRDIKRQHQLMLPPIAVVEHARREMRERRVGAVLVTDDEQRFVGIFAGSDAVSPVLAEGKSAAETRLPEVMTRDPEALALGRTAIEALRLMQDCGFRRVPVVAGGPGRGRGLARRLPGP